MTLPPILEAALTEFSVEHVLVLGMLLTSLLLVAVFMERCFIVLRARLALRAVRKIVTTARTDGLEAAHTASQSASALAKPVLLAGLDRATGRVPGDPRMALGRELRRFAGALKARLWLLATAGALMPFVGLFGTVLGVMASFEAIGESGQGGFAVVSVGISQALIATAVGIAVALEGVLLYNFLQNLIGKLNRELGLLVDELLELILVIGRDDAVRPEG